MFAQWAESPARPEPGGRELPAARPGWAAAVVAIGLIAVLALIAFDLGPPLVFNDDWQYAWSVRQLLASHGFHLLPLTNALALVQTVSAAALTLGHPDQRLLRLSVVPFALLAAICCYKVARLLNVDHFWSALAGVALLSSPLFLANTTTFMSDTPYVGLLLATALAGVAWLRRGTARALFVCLCILCPLQRQVGLTIPAAITIALVLGSRIERRPQSDWLFLAAAWCGAIASTAVPVLSGLSSGLGGTFIAHEGLAWYLLPAVMLPGMIGLLLVPFGAALVTRVGGRLPTGRTFLPPAIAAAGISVACAVAIQFNAVVFPGNVFTRAGFVPELAGKDALFPDLLFVAIEAAAMVAFTGLAFRLRDAWRQVVSSPPALFLTALAVVQFLPLLALRNYPWDRYYLAVAAPLLPLAAMLAARGSWPRLAGGWALVFLPRGWALGFLALGVGLYLVGEQDYVAWQVARDQAARLAYRIAPPTEVQAGYGANVVYAELPMYERTGDPAWLLNGAPLQPRVRLVFARSDDPRPGVGYISLRPGKVVLHVR